jgi:predicted Zn-dependent protease
MKRRLLYLLAGLLTAGLLSGCSTLGTVIKAGGHAAGYSDLEDMGSSMEKANRDFTEEEKYYIGRTVAATLMADSPLLANAKLTDYVNAVGTTLVLASSRPELFHGYHFAVLDSDKVNAYACPGGFLFITRGLLFTCHTEDELAGVLAHEISHIVLDHPIQAIQASHQRAALTSLVKFGVRKAGESYDEVTQLTGVFDNVVKDVVQAVGQGYSRDKEQEADHMAVDLTVQAGYSPLALASVLDRMESGSSTHGDPKVRAAAVRAASPAAVADNPGETLRGQRFEKSKK